MIVAALRNNINKEGNLDVTQKTGKQKLQGKESSWKRGYKGQKGLQL